MKQVVCNTSIFLLKIQKKKCENSIQRLKNTEKFGKIPEKSYLERGNLAMLANNVPLASFETAFGTSDLEVKDRQKQPTAKEFATNHLVMIPWQPASDY